MRDATSKLEVGRPNYNQQEPGMPRVWPPRRRIKS